MIVLSNQSLHLTANSVAVFQTPDRQQRGGFSKFCGLSKFGGFPKFRAHPVGGR